MSLLKQAVLGAAFVVLGAGTSLAAQATVSLNVRSGPSTGYGVVDVLSAGETVSVENCRSNGWCYITHNGPDGWVSRNYLTDTQYNGRGGSVVVRPNDNPDVSFSFSVPGFGFSVGTDDDFRRGPSHRFGRVCFYEDYNFRGRSFCARPGEADRRLGAFNDRISSIRVSGGAEVRVCEDFNFNGRCAVVSRDMSSLRGRNNDIISSYRVR